MGVIKINGVTYGGGDNSVMLTQAEYDALVEAGTVDPTVLYMITDKNSENTAYAATVSYANTDSGLSATNVQNAIDEIVEDGIPADTIPYDNITSGLAATDMQSAIDEVVGDIDTLTASQIGYSNTTSGLTATDTQAAIDELAPVKSSIGNIDNVDLTGVQAGDLMQWQTVNGSLKLVPYSGCTNSINQSWGTSVESNYTNKSQFLVMVAATDIYTVWFASTDNVNVKCWSTNTTATGSNSATLNGFTFTRTNQTGVTNIYKLGISTSNSTAFTIFN